MWWAVEGAWRALCQLKKPFKGLSQWRGSCWEEWKRKVYDFLAHLAPWYVTACDSSGENSKSTFVLMCRKVGHTLHVAYVLFTFMSYTEIRKCFLANSTHKSRENLKTRLLLLICNSNHSNRNSFFIISGVIFLAAVLEMGTGSEEGEGFHPILMSTGMLQFWNEVYILERLS